MALLSVVVSFKSLIYARGGLNFGKGQTQLLGLVWDHMHMHNLLGK